MKKILGFLVAACITLTVSAGVGISNDKVDKATGSRVIETTWVSISTQSKSIPDIHLRFCYRNGEEFLEVRTITGRECNVRTLDYMRIVPEKGTNLEVFPAVNSTSNVGEGSIDYAGSHSIGIYLIYWGDFSWMLDNKPKTLKINTSVGLLEYKIPKGSQKDIQKAYKKFFERINKHYKKK